MGMLQNALKKWKEKKEEREGYERQQNITEGFEQRKLSHNERLLNQFLEEERQEKIKAALKKFQDRDTKDTWSGKKWNPVNAPNMFANEKNIFAGKSTLLKGSTLLGKTSQEENLFFKNGKW